MSVTKVNGMLLMQGGDGFGVYVRAEAVQAVIARGPDDAVLILSGGGSVDVMARASKIVDQLEAPGRPAWRPIDVSRDLLVEALRQARGNRTEAARALGVSRASL